MLFLCFRAQVLSKWRLPSNWTIQVKVTLRLTVSQSVSLGVEPHLRVMTRYLFLTVTKLFFWGPLSDERTGLSFVYVPGPRQRSLSQVRVPWDSWQYLTVSDLRLPISSPPTIRRVTVEVFKPDGQSWYGSPPYNPSAWTTVGNSSQ
jgi:hypothetical protein